MNTKIDNSHVEIHHHYILHTQIRAHLKFVDDHFSIALGAITIGRTQKGRKVDNGFHVTLISVELSNSAQISNGSPVGTANESEKALVIYIKLIMKTLTFTNVNNFGLGRGICP
ncbi:hypothetical protein DERF_012445 [Dermatophagoides farinae]|uniref:Uncharacterized protein n=1 Tax=Dermatophagoides farinae TaxID=6954 RepID=A0A922HQ26_DERFA|nr:hypothetical protein DERF_012445 [Dermatophagoides farinae]